MSLYSINILPKHIWDGLIEEHGVSHASELEREDIPDIGSGPFKLVEYTRGDRAVWEVNDDHWMEFDFDRFVWDIYGDQSSVAGDMESGTISWTHQLTTTNFESLEGVDGVDTFQTPNNGFTMFFMQSRRDPFSDLRFRHAICHLIDKEEIVNIAAAGRGFEGYPVSPALEFWHNPDIARYNGGLEAAEGILEEYGYDWDDNGNLRYPVDRFENEEAPKYLQETEEFSQEAPPGFPDELDWQESLDQA